MEASYLLHYMIIEKNLIKLTHYDETKKSAHDSQIVKAKENLKLSHGGPSKRQASCTNPPIKALSWDTILHSLLTMHLNFRSGLSALLDLLPEHQVRRYASMQSEGQHDTDDKIKLLLYMLTICVQL